MDFRSKKADSDASDSEPEAANCFREDQEEGQLTPSPGPNQDAGDEPVPKKRLKQNMWTDFLEEEQLEKAGSSINLDMENRQRIRRGPESYDRPLNKINSYAPDKRHKPDRRAPNVIVSPPEEELFGETADLAAVETFGIPENEVVLDSTAIRSIKANVSFRGRGRGRGSHHGIMPRDPSKQNRKFAPGSTSRGGGHAADSNNRKRNAMGVVRQPQKALMSSDFSSEVMQNAEFTVDTPCEQLGDEMARLMGERDGDDTVRQIVKAIKQEKAIELFNDMRETEAAGGMMVLDGSRRRTPGGVFIFLFKSDPEIDTKIKDAIFEEGKRKMKAIAKANKRKNKAPRTFEESLQQAETAMRNATKGSDNGGRASVGQQEDEEGERSSETPESEFKIKSGEFQDMEF